MVNKNVKELTDENQNMDQNSSAVIATELVLEKLKAANINIITDQKEMQAILDAGIEVQKMSAHYGTNQNIENAESFNGYGVYVLSVNEENAKNLGLKIASKKYGNSFYINNQPLQEFLQDRNFSPYWQSLLIQIQNPSNEALLNTVITSDVKGNPVLLNEQNQLSMLCSLNLIHYKREQTYLYSVEIPDNDGTNYLYYDKTIGLENAERINKELSKIGTNWKVSRNDTGNSVYFNILSDKVFTSQKQASEFLQKAGYVGMETSNENYIIFDDREMNINNRVQYMITENGELYGFAYNGQIYADKNLMNSNVLAHEYTHLWDNYTKNKNPELWELGKNVFKKTAIWNEVVNDPSYQNIKNNDDEILSECHSRIVGKFAQSVLERIAAENGENAKNAVIDWNKEVNNFVAKEFGFSPELGSENYISEAVNAESMKVFLEAPMKDLMNGVGFEKDIKKAQRYHTENILQLNRSIGQYKDNFLGEESQVALEKLDKYLQEIRTAASPIKADEFLKNIQNIMHVDEEKSKTVRHFIGKEESNLRISNHSANAVHAQFRPNETSVVIKLSSTKFKADKNSYLAEYVYESKNLSKEKQLGIINGLKDWINTGDFTDKNFDKEYYSPSKELYMQMKNQNAKPQKMVISNGVEHNMNENDNPIEPLYFGDINEDGSVNTYNKEQYIEKFDEEPPESARLDDYQVKNWQNEENKNLVDADYTDPIEALEEAYNTLENPPTEEDIEAEKILHDKYIQNELDKTIEDLQANGGLSDAAIEAEIAAQEEVEAYEEDSNYNEKEEPVLTFNDTNGNPHYLQEIVSVLENFQRVEASKWNLPAEEKTAVFHLMQLTEIEKKDFEKSLALLQKYMDTEEFKREEKNYSEIFTPILLTSMGQDYDKETQTWSSEKFSYKFSTDDLKPEIPVKKGEIKSILDNIFSGGNVKLTQDFQDELIEKGLVKPEEIFVLINEVEAVANGTKIKADQPSVMLTIPVENNGRTEFVQTKYYHVSALEDPQKLEKNIEENSEGKQVDKDIIIYGKTKVPEFAAITQHGLTNFTDMVINSYEESSNSYLLVSEDGKKNIRVTDNTLKVLTSDEYARKSETYTQDTKTAEKMIDAQYNDFFQPRDNCANNFRHNLAVFCRKEANSPLDAIKVANSLISQMSKEEKQKTKELLNLLRKDGQTVNEVLIENYHEAVKETPLNEDYIKHNRYEKMIARPMYDTLSTKGEIIDRDFNLKIGDSVDITFKVDKNVGSKFSLRKESIYQNCTIISASKEGNVVTLMDGNKSFYDVPRDTFLKEYAHKQKNEHKVEKRVHHQQSMQIDIGR